MPTIVTRAMYKSTSWDWLNNSWFADFSVAGDNTGVSIGKSMRNQLDYDLTECTKAFKIHVAAAEQAKKQNNEEKKGEVDDK